MTPPKPGPRLVSKWQRGTPYCFAIGRPGTVCRSISGLCRAAAATAAAAGKVWIVERAIQEIVPCVVLVLVLVLYYSRSAGSGTRDRDIT